MEFKIISEKQNPVMKRREILAEMKYDGATPSKAQVQEHAAAKLSVNPENLEVSKILSEHGKPAGKAWIKIWENRKIPIYSQVKIAEQPKEAPQKAEEPKKEDKK